jgi:DNA polymerase elongation subunit (family B)
MEDKAKQIKKLDLKQNAIKILINSIYGAFGNKWFYFYNPDIAQSITLQGQDLIKFSIKAVNHYFLEKWHLDSELHQLLGISQYKINKIESEAAIYTDTDSCAGSSKIRSKKYGELSIEEWYQLNEKNGSAGETLAGHESVHVSKDDAILNYHEGALEFHRVRRIIRHRVSKARWKITTSSGKEVVVTGDHSVIVFREGCQVEVKAADIVEGDVVLTVSN